MRLRRAARRDPSPAPASTPEGREIVAALERLRTTTAREVMTPRVDVDALALPVTSADVARAVKESGHSRFPVYGDDLDDLAGVLFVKDLFRIGNGTGEVTPELIARRLRKPFLVPESRHALELLQEMRQGRRAFAVVVDEYGGVEGVLTIKDLVGELLGALPDEFDPVDAADITRIDAERWLVDGQTPVDRVRDELGAPVPDGPFVTLGGFLFERFGRVPADGDAVV
ncbi:MAG TPA: transporter associated domain-containing protein, partial [Acidimicrobiales bacterium]|nr:transporter associated domain-containing protein [Acidimicrobiales bacterium]